MFSVAGCCGHVTLTAELINKAKLVVSVWHIYGQHIYLIMFFPLSNISLLHTAECGPLLTQVYSQENEMQPCSFCSVVFGSRPRHVKLNFCFSTESQQAACLGPIKSTTLMSLLILKGDVKTNKWTCFMSEVNWLPFSVPPGLFCTWSLSRMM